MIVYTRTDEGQLAAYGTASVLPRKLRSLLKVIDGKTPASVYNDSLKAFGDVEGVLTSLQMAGLIRAMGQMPANPNEQKASVDVPETAGNTWGNTSGLQAQAASMSVNFAHTNTTAIAHSAGGSQSLGRAVDLMSNFVLTYAPEQAFLVLKELEDLTDMEQLAVTLGGYEMLIAHVGPLAQEHILLIKQILKESL